MIRDAFIRREVVILFGMLRKIKYNFTEFCCLNRNVSGIVLFDFRDIDAFVLLQSIFSINFTLKYFYIVSVANCLEFFLIYYIKKKIISENSE